MSLSGQVALVTGASSGIGLAIAQSLSDAGVKMVISGRRAELLSNHATVLGNCVAMAGDIAAPGFPESLFDRVMTEYGRLDVVVNNAGLVESGPIESIDVDRVCEMVRVNVEASFRICYLAVKHFKQTGSGQLINTTSVLGTKVRAEIGAYAGTKHALEALSEALRLELNRTGIRITCIEPGLVRTDLHRHWQTRPERMQNVGEPLVPDDVARTVMFALEQPPHAYIPRLMVLPRDQAI